MFDPKGQPMKFLVSVSAFALASVIGSSAFAADLIVDNVAIDAASPAATWEGAYVGAHAGFGAGTVDWDFADGDPGEEYDIDGWVLGGQIGYNWQVDNIVFGLEADLSVSTITGEYASFASRDINWLASARGRVGFALDSVLLYGTAGLAVANSTGTLAFFNDTNTHFGWTAGLGAEVMVSDNVSLKAEYRYSVFGAESYYLDFIDTGFTTHTATVGVNFHF
jgi:opacity protein-like surface antigen